MTCCERSGEVNGVRLTIKICCESDSRQQSEAQATGCLILPAGLECPRRVLVSGGQSDHSAVASPCARGDVNQA